VKMADFVHLHFTKPSAVLCATLVHRDRPTHTHISAALQLTVVTLFKIPSSLASFKSRMTLLF